MCIDPKLPEDLHTFLINRESGVIDKNWDTSPNPSFFLLFSIQDWLVCSSFCGVIYQLCQLHYTALHYTTLHYTTPHHTTLHYTTLHYTTPDHTTLHYTTCSYTPPPPCLLVRVNPSPTRISLRGLGWNCLGTFHTAVCPKVWKHRICVFVAISRSSLPGFHNSIIFTT